ncbi:DNA cytosine methyltransferase [Rossellomorea sp. NPDC071047]|uniref:DNA cytosine methyltransferase n=1 Tax=Rossellomorea sp. NPDC071047 TaxID=3390675 RepID=UPI003CFF7A2B
MKTLLKKVYALRKKNNKPGVWLQHLVCETAGLKEGDPLYIEVDEEREEISLQNKPLSEDDYVIHVSGRLNRSSGVRRPLVDSAGDRYSFLSLEDKVEITVYRKGNLSRIVVRPLEYRLKSTCTIPAPKDERITFTSICAGAGIGTAHLASCGYFTPVQEIELETDSAEVIKHNFPGGYLFNGDLRDCHETVQSDMCVVSLPCNQASSLGDLEGNVMDDLILATAKIIKSSKASCLLFENVPNFYQQDCWHSLKELLMDDYPYFSEKQIESWDFGSIATRRRKYVVAFRERDLFENFQWPSAPKLRRKKLKDFLDGKRIEQEWKPLDKWVDSFNSRNAWSDRNLDKTFVTGEAKQINCIPKRYRGHSASSSYILNDAGTHWRFLSESELFRIFDIPDTFSFPDHTSITRRYEMIGQSICGRVFKAIGNKIATSFMKRALKGLNNVARKVKEKVEPISIKDNGQLELII